MSKYSGKMLCDVPEEELYVGMRVISLIGTPGEITGFRLPPEDRYLSIDFK